MAHESYEDSKKFGKGHLGVNPKNMGSIGGVNIVLALVGLGLIVFSIYKAYYIVYKFMHMGHEAKGLRMTVLLPMLLLVWALIAFFNEGNAWKDRRHQVDLKNAIELNDLGQVVKEEVKKMK